jgi:aspartokinase/homoserine dehydrogenase 1
MKVLKFGGSSVGDETRINSVIDILLNNYLKKNDKIAVVFSAFQGVTDKLIELGNLAYQRNQLYKEKYNEIKNLHYRITNSLQNTNSSKIDFIDKLFSEMYDIVNGIFLVKELTPRTLDYLMSFGERLSCTIIANAMRGRKIDCEFLDASNVVKTDNSFNSARVNFDLTNKLIQEYFRKHKATQIITGFIGSTNDNEITTLGRGGSDYTASIFGAALNCEEIQIWTDVDGILTSDPRIVPDAISLKAVTYEEAMELSHFGAKVIHPPTMAPAMKNKIKIRIKNTFNPEFKGTVIIEREEDKPFSIKGISSIENISLVRIQGSGMVGVTGIASRIFSAMARKKINIILITQASSEHSISFAISPEKTKEAKAVLEEDFKLEILENKISNIEVKDDLSIIAVVGEDMRNTPGVSGVVFNSLGKNGINIAAIAHGSSELNISLVINKHDLKKALNVLHQDLFKFSTRTINVFMVGPGSVGSKLINLFIERKEYIQKNLGLNLNVISLSDSKKTLINPKGIDLSKWKDNLEKIGEKSNPAKLIEKIKEFNLPNSVFVDCTANDDFIKFYEELFKNAISIVTPNKIANTLDYGFYDRLHKTAKHHNVKFNYSTNVGAALPIINNMQNLIRSGDEIIKIEGVLSGTLSFIFNMMNENMTFSEAVFTAQQKQYTEPDPRDDLSGLDIARKLLILIRETGIRINLDQIEVENLVPKSLQKTKFNSTFYEELSKVDNYYSEKMLNAKKKNSRLMYVARFQNGKAKVCVEEINSNHPFYLLKDKENIISLTTRVYHENPLVIKGAGAGSEYTAYGILMDILRIIN